MRGVLHSGVRLALLFGAMVAHAQDSIVSFLPTAAQREVSDFWARAGKTARAAEKKHDWLSSAESLESVLELVAAVPSGRALLKRLAPAMESGELAVESVYGEKAQRLLVGGNLGGFYLGGTVYLDERSPLLAAIGFLFHELVHADDFLSTEEMRLLGSRIAKSFDEGLALRAQEIASQPLDPEAVSRWRREQKAFTPVAIKTEYRAYAAQNRFVREWVRLDPIFEKVFLSLVAKREWIAYPFTQDHLRRVLISPASLALPEEAVDAYLIDFPFVWQE